MDKEEMKRRNTEMKKGDNDWFVAFLGSMFMMLMLFGIMIIYRRVG